MWDLEAKEDEKPIPMGMDPGEPIAMEMDKGEPIPMEDQQIND